MKFAEKSEDADKRASISFIGEIKQLSRFIERQTPELQPKIYRYKPHPDRLENAGFNLEYFPSM
jgi:hypothetical protein